MKNAREVLAQFKYRCGYDWITPKESRKEIDQALIDLSEIVMGEQESIMQHHDDYNNGIQVGWNEAIDHIASLFKDKEQTKKGER